MSNVSPQAAYMKFTSGLSECGLPKVAENMPLLNEPGKAEKLQVIEVGKKGLWVALKDFH